MDEVKNKKQGGGGVPVPHQVWYEKYTKLVFCSDAINAEDTLPTIQVDY